MGALGQEVTEAQLREVLSQETLAGPERLPDDIVAELAQPQTYRRGRGDTRHQIDVTLLEAGDDNIHVNEAGTGHPLHPAAHITDILDRSPIHVTPGSLDVSQAGSTSGWITSRNNSEEGRPSK
jgi:hypothetical protein